MSYVRHKIVLPLRTEWAGATSLDILQSGVDSLVLPCG